MGNPAPRHDNYAKALVTEVSASFKDLLVNRRVPDNVIAELIAALPAVVPQLAQLARDDLESAFFSLLDAFRARVARAVAGLERPASGDEDFAQMGLVIILEMLREGQDVKDPRALFLVTATCKGLDEARQVLRRQINSASNLPESACLVPGPLQFAASKEELRKAIKMLSQNPNWDRVARLAALGLSNQEIAAYLQIPERTITYWRYQMSAMWEKRRS